MTSGATTVASHRPTFSFPSLSAACGLVANAPGLNWTDSNRFAALATGITIASRPGRGSHVLPDLHTAHLTRADRTWTTRGIPATRTGFPATYQGSHLLFEDHLQDAAFTVCLALSPGTEAPSPARILAAFPHPARTLYICRRSCVPTTPIVTDPANDILSTATADDVLRFTPGTDKALAAEWPACSPLGTTRNAIAMHLRANQHGPENLHTLGHRHVCSGTVTPVQTVTAAR